MITNTNRENRFDSDARRYAEYLETPDGRLRADLTFTNLLDILPKQTALHVLDVGCGTGATAVRLANLGFHVTFLDSSSAMLALGQQTVVGAGVTDRVAFKLGDASELAEIFQSQPFDVVLCHNLLEYVVDPEAVLRSAKHVMRDSSSILSVLVRNQAGEVLKAALQKGDLNAAENSLNAEWGHESLYGGRVRFFAPEKVESMLKNASLEVFDRRGVRCLSDYLPTTISRSDHYEQIFALEQKIGKRAEFFGVARYLHFMVRKECEPERGR